MNDNDVIKAFEKYRDPSCLVDVWYDEDGKRQEVTLRDVQDLINRLQAENERLKIKIEDLESMQEISPEAKYLVDTKADKVISLLNEINKSQGQIKSEARKEFAERLKIKGFSDDIYGEVVVYIADVDNLLEEMEKEE